MKKTLILWDIDGTLLLTGGSGKATLNRVFEELYNQTDIWQNISPDGRTDDAILEELFFNRFGKNPDEVELKKIADLYTKYLEGYLQTIPNFTIYPHVASTLEQLSKDTNITLGLATGNYKNAAYLKLKRANLHQHFSFGGFGCDSKDRQTLTQKALERGIAHMKTTPDKVILVGDTIFDIRCGKGIGAITVGVCTGSTKRDTLERENADFVLDDLQDFLKIL